jgi:hypothetical protein
MSLVGIPCISSLNNSFRRGSCLGFVAVRPGRSQTSTSDDSMEEDRMYKNTFWRQADEFAALSYVYLELFNSYVHCVSVNAATLAKWPVKSDLLPIYIHH